MVVMSRNQEQTRGLGLHLGQSLRGLDVICLYGELGSGKTTFTQGLARALGFRGNVASPTFVLAKVYKGKGLKIYHLDLYRIARGLSGDIGIEEYVSDPKGVCVVEWPHAGEVYYPKDRVEIRFSHGRREGERKIVFRARGPRSRALVGRLK